MDGGATTYASTHTFNHIAATWQLGTQVFRNVTYHVQPTVFINSTDSIMRIEDGHGFNADGTWSGHYLGLQPNATGSLNLLVHEGKFSYALFFDP